MNKFRLFNGVGIKRVDLVAVIFAKTMWGLAFCQPALPFIADTDLSAPAERSERKGSSPENDRGHPRGTVQTIFLVQGGQFCHYSV